MGPQRTICKMKEGTFLSVYGSHGFFSQSLQERKDRAVHQLAQAGDGGVGIFAFRAGDTCLTRVFMKETGLESGTAAFARSGGENT